MNGLPEPLPPAPCRQDEALVPTELCRSLLRRRSDPFRFLGGIVCTCFSQCTSTTSGRVAVFMASWRETGEWPSSALPLHSTPLRPATSVSHFPAPPRTAFSRLTSAAFGRASRTGLPAILLNPPRRRRCHRLQQWPRSPPRR